MHNYCLILNLGNLLIFCKNKLKIKRILILSNSSWSWLQNKYFREVIVYRYNVPFSSF